MEDMVIMQGQAYSKQRQLDFATCDVILKFKPIVEYTKERKFMFKRLVLTHKELKSIQLDTNYSKDDILGYIRKSLEDMVDGIYTVSCNRSFTDYWFVLTLKTSKAF